MRTEVTLRIFDPLGRTGYEWVAMLDAAGLFDDGAEPVTSDDEEV